MAKRKKGDRKLSTDRNVMERAEEDEREIVQKDQTTVSKTSFEDPFFQKGDDVSFDDPLLGREIDSMDKPTDDDQK